MIRVTLLLIVVAFFSFYAWRNWFVSTCAAVLLMAVVQHPDFPKSMLGLQGLNPWNLLLLSILLAWLNQRKQQGLVWDLPRRAQRMLLAFFAVIVISAIRFMTKAPVGYTFGSILSEDVINCIKWVIPGLILFDACRTRRRVVIAVIVVLALYLLLAIQVVRWMPLSYAASGDELSERASKIIQNEIGYNRVTLSMMLAGASWAMLCATVMLRKNWHRLAVIGAAAVIALGQALTAGRTGYVSWAAVGLVLCLVRWRKLLPIIPIAVICLFAALPGVRQRMFEGFGGKQGDVIVDTSDYEITSGRNLAWPRVIEEIRKAPLFGYGRQAMTTTGIKDELWDQLRESFPHPHEAYLEQLLDNGVVGFLLVMPIYFFALSRSFRLVLNRSDPLVCAVGCAAFSLTLALLVGAFGGQTFYPREGAVGLWAAIGIMLRVSLQTTYSLESGAPLFADDEEVNPLAFNPHESEPLPA